MENYDSILVFDRPLILNNKKVYGYLYDSVLCATADEKEYISYLVGADKWQAHSNMVNSDKTWTDTHTNITYSYNSPYVQDYYRMAYHENPVSYFFKENIDINYEEEFLDDYFIINENFWKNSVNMILDLNVAGKEQEKEQIKVGIKDEDSDEELPF